MQAGTNFPRVRRMLLSFSPLIFRMLLANLHAASWAPCSYHSVSSWDRSSNSGALGLRWWGSPGQIIPSEGFWSRIFNVTRNSLCELNTSDWALPQIDEDFGDSTSWNTHPNGRVIFNIATALLSPFCNHSWSCRPSILEDATFHRMEWCKFLWGNPCKAIETFYHWLRVLDAFFSSCCMKEFGSCTLLSIETETAIVSFHTLPVSSPLPTFSKNSLYTLFCSLILDHGVCLIISVSGLKKIFIRKFCSTLLFAIVFNLCQTSPAFFWWMSILKTNCE